MDLPLSLQLAPLFSFSPIDQSAGDHWWLAGGNFYNVIPYEGRYDAQALALFGIDNKNEIRYKHQPALAAVNGQTRDMKWLRTAKHGKVLVVAMNNEKLKAFKLSECSP
jgi:hypothetical protein